MSAMLVRATAEAIPLADGTVQCVITSPPYWRLRKYGVGFLEIGREPTPEAYVSAIVGVCREIRRVLRPDGSLWLNLGDSYFKRQLAMIPALCAIALGRDGWRIRCDVVWHKPNAKPENVSDRPARSHEYIYLLSKSDRYYYDADAVAVPASDALVAQVAAGYNGAARKDYAASGAQDPSALKARIIGNMRKRGDRFGGKKHDGDTTQHSDGSVYVGRPYVNRRSVWVVNTRGYAGQHFATFPEAVVRPCVLASSPYGGIVLDPFAGSGTTGRVAVSLGRRFVGLDLNEACLSRQARPRLSVPSCFDFGAVAEVS